MKLSVKSQENFKFTEKLKNDKMKGVKIKKTYGKS